MRRGLLLALLALAACPATAGAHSIVRVNSGVVTYISSDATSRNELVISSSGANIRFYDPPVDGGIDPGTSCTPGETDDTTGAVIEVFCPRAGINQVRVEVGEREDSVASSVDVPVLALGGNGIDTITSGGLNDILVGNEGVDTVDGGDGNDQVNGNEGDDTLRGGAGDDAIQAGPGADDVDGGAGNDDLRVHDGAVDRIRCGDGTDKVDADTFDDVAPDCETVVRAAAAPAVGADGAATGAGGGTGDASLRGDKTAPKLRVGGSTSQKLRSGRRMKLLATSSERGTVAASGFLDVAGLRLPLKSKAADVKTAGGGAE
ncbi:MAG TPA: calcium-binding protein, partial [Solirubrobacteraceae bacterium]